MNANTQSAGPPMGRKLSLKSRIAVILIIFGLIALMEARHPFPFFRLATFILVFLALAVMASQLRGKLRDGLVVLASLAFGLSIVEATAAIFLETKVSAVTTNGLSVLQPVVGWGPEHAGRFHAKKTDPNSGALIYKPIIRSMQICYERPTRPRLAQRSFFLEILTPSEKAWAMPTRSRRPSRICSAASKECSISVFPAMDRCNSWRNCRRTVLTP